MTFSYAARATFLAAALCATAAVAQDAASRRPAAPVPPSASREQTLATCRAQAAGKQLTGRALDLFVSECVETPRAASAAGKPAAVAAVPAKGELDRSNEQRRREMDQQHDRWTKSANQALGSICAGCAGGKAEPARPARAKRSAPRRPKRDDGDAAEPRDND